MGKHFYARIIILIVLFLVAGAYAYAYKPEPPSTKPQPLSAALAAVDGWHATGGQVLEPFIFKALKLDDYLFQSYRKGSSIVSLYIGYYLSETKVGAAHDPLVCFPGQGWVLGRKSRGELALNETTGHHIFYNSMVAEKGKQRELVLYWFQSNQSTSSNTFMQKLRLLRSRLLGGGGENAFVRLSASAADKPLEQVRAELIEFARTFYPQFLEYTQQES